MTESIKIHPKAKVAFSGALRVALLYAGFSGLWILLSDRAVEVLVRDPAAMTRVSIAKGWVFVAVTATLLFILVKRLVDGVASREAKLRTLIHAIPDQVWLKDPEGVYLGCNRAFERLYGASEAEILGKTDYDFVPREQADFFRKNDQEALGAAETHKIEEWVTQVGSREEILLESLKTPIYDDEGRPIGVLGIGRDITEHRKLLAERERLQVLLNQAQKMEMVGRFAGGVAHDYNNMLAVILANTGMLQEQLPLGRPERKHLEEIAHAARHSAELTSQLLAFARQQPVEPRPVDLNEALAGIQGVLERLVGPEINLICCPGDDLWPIRMDTAQLGQVLTNLVVNARDAISGPGRIELSTANQTLTMVDCHDRVDAEPGDYVRLSVSDSGRGMSPEVLDRIFEPFFTTKDPGKGTGLGLAVVHGAVKQNHGAILVESELGRGSSFHAYFPRG